MKRERLLFLLMMVALSGPGCNQCPQGQTRCGEVCIDTRADNGNCGACGNACAGGQICSAGQCALSCQAGLVNCNGTCIDPQTNRSFCGASADCQGTNAGSACAAGQVCSAGQCALSCQAGLVNCNGTCIDPQTDRSFCGASAGCQGTSAGSACSAGQVCSAGQCTLSCQAGLVDCNGACIDPQTDRSFCGASADCQGANAGSACPAGQVCSAGQCALSCQAGLVDCNGTCINPQTDRSFCGASADCQGTNAGSACATGQVCSAGQCALSCQAGLVDCNGTCINPQTDRSFCGASADCQGTNAGSPCAAGLVCSGGQCQASCGEPLIACNLTCVDPRFDPNHCGSCDNACSPFPNAIPVCSDSNCVFGPCRTGFVDCDRVTDNGCEIDTRSDLYNCGGCNQYCSPYAAIGQCTDGTCGIAACYPPFLDCDNQAANGCEIYSQLDPDNCGSCGNRCGTGSSCQAGACTCDVGLLDCDNQAANGCEIDSQSDADNCGACGNRCGPGFTCVNGQCGGCLGPFSGSGAGGGSGTTCLATYTFPVVAGQTYLISTCASFSGDTYLSVTGACSCANDDACGGGSECSCTATSNGTATLCASTFDSSFASWNYSVCPAQDSQCLTRTCDPVTGACQFVNSPLGTACSQDSGSICDGRGRCVDVESMVVRVGDGIAVLSAGIAAPVAIERYRLNGTLVSSTALPTFDAFPQRAFASAGGSASEGNLSRSADGRYVTMAGYNTFAGTTNVTSTTGIVRVVARVDASGNVDTSTVLDNAFVGSNVRGATSDDGTRFWVAGTSNPSTTGGVHVVDFGSIGPSTRIASTPNNSRFVHVFGGQLYVTSGANSFTSVLAVGTGLPTTAGQTATALPGLPTSNASPYSFALLDLNPLVPGVDTLYLATDTFLGPPMTPGNIAKWTFDGFSWTQQVVFTTVQDALGNTVTTGARGLTAIPVGTGVVIIASTSETLPNRLVYFVDDGTNTPSDGRTIATSTGFFSATAFRGVALPP